MDDWMDQAVDDLSKVTLMNRISALEDALKPFADISDGFAYSDDTAILLVANGVNLTVGDLRRAKAALEVDQRSKALDELAKIDADLI